MHDRPLSWRALNLQVAGYVTSSLLHAKNPEPSAFLPIVESLSIVFYGQAYVVPFVRQGDRELRRIRMTHRIGNRLLTDMEQRVSEAQRQRGGAAREPGNNSDLVARYLACGLLQLS